MARTTEGEKTVRRLTPAQYQAEVRKQQRAIDEYNRKARQHNARVGREAKEYNRRAAAHDATVIAEQRRQQRAVDDYNRKAQAHNRLVRANRQRLAQEIARLNARPQRITVPYEASVQTLHTSFERLEASSSRALCDDLLDLSEGETANSLAALNAMLTEPDTQEASAEEVAELQQSSIETELSQVDPDLDARWKGALYSLSPMNPDAARHFCTSAREMLSQLLVAAAPDAVVVEATPDCDRTPQGSVSRRARIRYCLHQQGTNEPALEDFVEHDIDNVLALFAEFNKGTHGGAGQFGLDQLRAINARVEDAVRFIYRIVP